MRTVTASPPPSMQVHHVQAAGLGSPVRFPREVANTHGRSHCKMQSFFSCQVTAQFLHTRCSHSVTRSFTGVWRELQLCLTDLPKLSPAREECGEKLSSLSPSFTALLQLEGRQNKSKEMPTAMSQSTLNSV